MCTRRPVIGSPTNKRPEPEDLKHGLFVHAVWSGYRDPQHPECDFAFGVRPGDDHLRSDINTWAAALDVNGLVADAVAMGVQYLIFTTWHAGRNPLYPSAVSAKYRGAETPSARLQRDVIADLLDEAEAHGLTVVLYVHPNDGGDIRPAGLGDLVADEARWNDYVAELAFEVATRYAGRVQGYWLDNAGIHRGGPADVRRFCEALRAGDPGCALYLKAKVPTVEQRLDRVYHVSEGKPFLKKYIIQQSEPFGGVSDDLIYIWKQFV